jgi:hypothetical protein
MPVTLTCSVRHVKSSEKKCRGPNYLVRGILATIIGLCKIVSFRSPPTCTCWPTRKFSLDMAIHHMREKQPLKPQVLWLSFMQLFSNVTGLKVVVKLLHQLTGDARALRVQLILVY